MNSLHTGRSAARRWTFIIGAAFAGAGGLIPASLPAETPDNGDGKLNAEVAETNTRSLVLYGRLSVNAYYLEPADQSEAFLMDDKSLNSRLGVRFHEELDHGLTAFGKIEWNIQPTSQDATAQMRDTHVGLRGAYGELAAGNFNGAYKTTGGVTWDPFVTTPLEARRQAAMAGGSYAQSGFMRRMVQYRTPAVQGFTGAVQLGADDRSSEEPHARQRDGQGDAGDVNLGGKYGIGDFELIGAYSRADRAPSGQNRNWKAGARWNNGTWDIAYQFEDVAIRDRIDFDGFDDVSDGVTVNNRPLEDDTRHHYSRVSYRTGPSQFHGVWGYMDSAGDETDITVYTLGYTHWFSENFRAISGVQFQDRDAAYTSGDLTVFSAGFRYDFDADLYRLR